MSNTESKRMAIPESAVMCPPSFIKQIEESIQP